MNLLVTGASGFIGSALIPKLLARGDKVYGLSRHPPAAKNLIPLVGDITEPNLGLTEPLKDIQAVYHLAGIVNLGEDKNGTVWRTNVEGTKNVLEFCTKNDIGHLFFASTAYTQGRNSYERSKALCETLIKQLDIPKVTIFKPSIIMPPVSFNYPGHFFQFIKLVLKAHHGAELTRRKLEETIRLPLLRPVFRITGNPDGRLNLIMVSDIAQAMASIEGEGLFWLVNDNPPKIKDLLDWVSEVILVNMQVEPRPFKATPIEATFQKMGAAFIPYLRGDNFKSDIKATPISKEYIQGAVRKSLLQS